MSKEQTALKPRKRRTRTITTDKNPLRDELTTEVGELVKAKEQLKALTAMVAKQAASVKKKMKTLKLKEFSTMMVVGEDKIPVKAAFIKAETNAIDYTTLIDEIGRDEYIAISTVTQAAITKAYGGNMTEKCLVKQKSTEKFIAARE